MELIKLILISMILSVNVFAQELKVESFSAYTMKGLKSDIMAFVRDKKFKSYSLSISEDKNYYHAIILYEEE